MFGAVLHRELKSNLSETTIHLTLLVLTLLAPLSACIQARHYSRVVADHGIRQSIHDAENDSHRLVVDRPISPLLPFFNGVYDQLPDEISLRIEMPRTEPSSEDLNPLDDLFPKADLSLIVGILLSLIAILLGHNA